MQDCRRLFDELESTLAASWDLMFEQAKSFYEKFGHLDVPRKYKAEHGSTLGTWISTQRNVRTGMSKGVLTSLQIDRLNKIGMVWNNRHEIRWDRHIAILQEYFNQYGNIDVPANYVTDSGFQLGNWIVKIRGSYMRGQLSKERIKELENIGMTWGKISYFWE